MKAKWRRHILLCRPAHGEEIPWSAPRVRNLHRYAGVAAVCRAGAQLHRGMTPASEQGRFDPAAQRPFASALAKRLSLSARSNTIRGEDGPDNSG
jgi:hypothetical protein